ncbi:hypothetical protein MRB53_008417 [Persea americana]|uniref:Uncharacterized protein n=1 Tax=Persea americana TaxID=3435 RepID=A0ACC2MM18_PERAE|nr:hypothetical protein MRB53_008417 [Persea americana]
MGRRKESRCNRSFSRRRCHSRLVRMLAQCLALVTACIPCVTFGEIAEIVKEGEESSCACAITYGVIAFFIGTPCLLSCCYRTKLRSKSTENSKQEASTLTKGGMRRRSSSVKLPWRLPCIKA